MPVAALAQFSPPVFFQAPASSSQGSQRLDTKVSAISTASDLTGRLSVTTAEGDTITLSAELEARYQSASVQGRADLDGTSANASAKSTTLSLTQQYGVTVQGDLSEQEVQDLDTLFRNVSGIFHKFFDGQDDAARARTSALTRQFGQASSLASLDLSVEVERSVTTLAAQMTSAVTGLSQDSIANPGGAPGMVAAIPQPSTGTTAPIPPPAVSPDGAHLAAPAQDLLTVSSLVRQIMDALEQSRLDVDKAKQYLPEFLTTLREELPRVRADRQTPATDQSVPTQETQRTAGSRAVFAYQGFRETAIALSIHS